MRAIEVTCWPSAMALVPDLSASMSFSLWFDILLVSMQESQQHLLARCVGATSGARPWQTSQASENLDFGNGVVCENKNSVNTAAHVGSHV